MAKSYSYDLSQKVMQEIEMDGLKNCQSSKRDCGSGDRPINHTKQRSQLISNQTAIAYFHQKH
jgi:hypothetical protein